MKFVLSNLILSAVFSAASAASPLILSLHDDASLEQHDACESGLISPAFINKVKSLMKTPDKLPSRLISKTTAPHEDFDRSTGRPVENPVAFVTMNTNPNAYFAYGDNEKIPIEEGNMFVFDGSVTHNTVVHSGQVELMGPFDTKTFGAVGGCIAFSIDDTSDASNCLNDMLCNIAFVAGDTYGGRRLKGNKMKRGEKDDGGDCPPVITPTLECVPMDSCDNDGIMCLPLAPTPT